jgi:transcriptional regulator with XRE-family HTH domain
MSNIKRVSTSAIRIKEAMERVGKKQIDLANETGLSHSTISRYISGAVEPRQKAAYLLAKSLNVSETWLWGYDVPMERSSMQIKNEELLQLVHLMKADEQFFDMVETLAQLDAEKRQTIKTVMDALLISGK